MRILKKSETGNTIGYTRRFSWTNSPGGGFMFACDKEGNFMSTTKEANLNLQKCLDGTFDVIDEGVIKESHRWFQSAIGECSCGETVELIDSWNQCRKCKVEYNSNGQMLSSREFWGEETGERF